jgi:Tannase and feruloyl esterase
MKKHSLLLLFFATVGALFLHNNDALAGNCSALAQEDLSNTTDAVTQITSTHVEGDGNKTPSYCEVGGYVTPNIRFRLRLPTKNWNGKLIELGCGGTCGTTEHVVECNTLLRRGYACIVSDGGNSSSGVDMKWAYNNPQAVIEYVVRASHVTALAGKAIAQQYYQLSPRLSYFTGCSAGGLQAMSMAQRFPWDFDGIVAGDPSLSVSEDWMNWLWIYRTLLGEHGSRVLSERDLETLHGAVLARCDLNDGVKDGVIGDPRSCAYDPGELSCKQNRHEGCFSDLQVEAARKMYAGPSTRSGTPIGVPFAFKGSELHWLDPGTNSSDEDSYLPEWFRYYLFQPNPGPSWTLENFDFDRDYKRFGIAELTEPLNPDLRRFRDHGGKLLLYSGWNDTAASVGRAVDYYENAEKVMGGRMSTQSFFRLFVVPGMSHCTGGEGAFAIDYLTYLESWVEKGEAPDKLMGFHVRLDNLMDRASKGDQAAIQELSRRLQFPLEPKTVEFSRPIYPYPMQAKYIGTGDPTDAANFVPVVP